MKSEKDLLLLLRRKKNILSEILLATLAMKRRKIALDAARRLSKCFQLSWKSQH